MVEVNPHSHPIAIKTQLQQEGSHNPYNGQAQPIKENAPLDLTERLLHKVTLPGLRDLAGLPNA